MSQQFKELPITDEDKSHQIHISCKNQTACAMYPVRTLQSVQTQTLQSVCNTG